MSCLVFVTGVAIQTGSHSLPVFVVGRIFAGLGVGLVSTLIPMYQSECSPKWIRGAVVSMYQWFITIGLLLASIVNNATKNRQDHSAWRIPTSMQFIWAFVLAMGFLWLPEVGDSLMKTMCLNFAYNALRRLPVGWLRGVGTRPLQKHCLA